MTYNILLVDDDQNQLDTVDSIIKNSLHYNTLKASCGKDAVNLLTSDQGKNIDMVLLDLAMPGMNGVEVINAVKPTYPNIPIVVRTGYDDVDMAIEAMKAGATDFIKKVDSIEHLQTTINQTLRNQNLQKEFSDLSEKKRSNQITFEDIVGESQAVNEMVNLGRKVAASDIPVLIEGESGCGKEFMARSIHNESERRDKPFIAVNCGAIPENLVESILFGHEKGSFTGALYKTHGKFREAEGGTIFLDEIGELPQDIQVKLLRVLQEGEIDPVGSSKPVKINVRIISATNRDLKEQVNEHIFREDLFYRLNVFPINVPPLRARKEDIHILLKYYMNQFIASENKVDIIGISSEAKDALINYNWPGNIRQLKNSIFRAIVLCDKNELTIEDFPQIIEESSSISSEELVSEQQIQEQESSSNINLTQDGGFLPLAIIEKKVIRKALEYYNGHMSKVAKNLGIGRSTLYRKVEEYDLATKPNNME